MVDRRKYGFNRNGLNSAIRGGLDGVTGEIAKSDNTASLSASIKLPLGFEPSVCVWWTLTDTQYPCQYVFDKEVSTNGCYGNQWSAAVQNHHGHVYSNELVSVDSDGITIAGSNGSTYQGTIRYYAFK